jgi:hypothetical protein
MFQSFADVLELALLAASNGHRTLPKLLVHLRTRGALSCILIAPIFSRVWM